jgi:hypothetical protein
MSRADGGARGRARATLWPRRLYAPRYRLHGAARPAAEEASEAAVRWASAAEARLANVPAFVRPMSPW